MSIIVREAQVESVVDEADGLRIKARISEENGLPIEKIPYAFPLLPKTIQSVPKEGECVFVILGDTSNIRGNRFYIGPVISQPQRHYEDKYSYGQGTSMSTLKGGVLEPLERISNYSETDGAFPEVNTVSIVGRDSEDIVLKDGEIDLRCGIRGSSNDGNINLSGKVIFNTNDPAYIQLKYKQGIGVGENRTANSVINLVADKINLISNQDSNVSNRIHDKKELIKTSEMDDIMKNLNRAVYGDKLVDFLKKLVTAVAFHTHSYPGEYSCMCKNINAILEENLDDLLSNNVRLS